jgi:hypothetical protein
LRFPPWVVCAIIKSEEKEDERKEKEERLEADYSLAHSRFGTSNRGNQSLFGERSNSGLMLFWFWPLAITRPIGMTLPSEVDRVCFIAIEIWAIYTYFP